MRYDDPQLRQLLAGEYVLGTLRGGARRRFERLLEADPGLRADVGQWESRLAVGFAETPPVAPPAQVWERLQTRLDQVPDTPKRRRWWIGVAVAAAVALFAIVIMLKLPQGPGQTARLSRLAVIDSTQGQALWIVSVDSAQHLVVRAVGATRSPQGKSYELWMLPAGGQPVSLGLLPAQGSTTQGLSARQYLALRQAKGLAVSLEPEGGSPTGLPTGPVLFQAGLLKS